MIYKIKFKTSAQKELNKLNDQTARRILKALTKLQDNPRGANSRQMVGTKSWRLLVGDYRAIYSIEDSLLVIEIIRIRHRRDVYK